MLASIKAVVMDWKISKRQRDDFFSQLLTVGQFLGNVTEAQTEEDSTDEEDPTKAGGIDRPERRAR